MQSYTTVSQLHSYTHILGFCLTGPFFQSYSKSSYSSLGEYPQAGFG